jgi:hypothetical protein
MRGVPNRSLKKNESKTVEGTGHLDCRTTPAPAHHRRRLIQLSP